jgi:hypothetical protein
MVKIHSLRDALHLIEITRIGPEVRIIDDPFAVTFEMQMINWVKPDQCGEQAPIRFGQGVAHQVPAFG